MLLLFAVVAQCPKRRVCCWVKASFAGWYTDAGDMPCHFKGAPARRMNRALPVQKRTDTINALADLSAALLPAHLFKG